MLIAWLGLSLLVGVAGSSRKIGFMGGFILAVILSPIIGIVIVLMSAKKIDTVQSEVNSEIEILKKEIEALKSK